MARVTLFMFVLNMFLIVKGNEYLLRATCDNEMTVCVDGQEMIASNMDHWREESTFSIPSDFKVVGIKCVDRGVIPGILASVHKQNGDEVIVTDESWRCTLEESDGWTEAGFIEDGAWEDGTPIAKHGEGIWSNWPDVGSISKNAYWIWTDGHPTYTTAYCRYTVPQPPLTLRATCDNEMTVYVDGEEMIASEMDNWTEESTFSIPFDFKVVGIKCVDRGVIPGILASVHKQNGDEVIVTDESWRCTLQESEGWTKAGFIEDGAWEDGTPIAKHGEGIWSNWPDVGSISKNAYWIWTDGHPTYTTAYCRYTVPQPPLTLRATCDNEMTVYVDGEEMIASGMDNWTEESTFSIPFDFKVVGIKCVDRGVIPGILASVHKQNGDEVIVTDESWRCTLQESEGWTKAGFIEDGAWEDGTPIAKHGEGIWSNWPDVGSISKNAYWIWTDGHPTYTTAYCRYTKH